MAGDKKKELFLDILEKNIGILIKVSRVFTRIEQDQEDLINDITLNFGNHLMASKETPKFLPGFIGWL